MYWLPAILILPYFLLMIKICRDLLKIKPFLCSYTPSVYISIIIPCRNDQDKLPALLESISAQDYPFDLFEVIIVDDNTEGHRIESVSGIAGPVKLCILKNTGRGKKAAIRTGVLASSGDLIITTDSDCKTGKSWIKTIASFYFKNDPHMIVCPVQLDAKRGFFGRFQELEHLGLQGITAATVAAGNGIMCNGANLAFTREAYLNNMDNLHFGLASGDDVFLLHSLKKKSDSKIMWLESADAEVTTAAASSLLSFFRQRKRWVSKWKAYTDGYTLLAAAVTLSAALLQASLFLSLFFDLSFVWSFLTILALKSLPDFLILKNTAARYGKKRLLRWFLPSQLIYPVYVLIVFLGSMMPERDGRS